MKIKYKIKEDPDFGYKYVSPLPSEEDLQRFYEREYYQHIQRTGRGRHDVKLISKERQVRNTELEWLHKTYFVDYVDVLRELIGSNGIKTILDIGCGTGELLEFMKASGWEVCGIEPSKEAFESAKEKGIAVYNLSLEEFIQQKIGGEEKFDVVILTNVLEHVINPKKTLEEAVSLLKTRGVALIRVPNDFNKLQNMASSKVNKKQWWVAIPDHLYYFDFQSLEKVLRYCGLEVCLKVSDFPMELFLLMGDNYVDNPDLGKQCHQKRVNFELSIPSQFRRDIYNKLAEMGVGRECIVYARKI